MKNRPTYAIESVDHALRLALLLAHEGPLRVAEAADRLGVARSTAHRLLAMLTYRDFAAQAEDRSYVAGPALRATDSTASAVSRLRTAAAPHLRNLRDEVQETVNLMVRAGARVRFVSSHVSEQVLRVDDRAGREMPIELTAGGKALLALLSPDQVATVFVGLPGRPADPAALARELRLVRRRRIALNVEQTEIGVTALGAAVVSASDGPVGAVTIALPSARFSRSRVDEWGKSLTGTAALIAADFDRSARAAAS